MVLPALRPMKLDSRWSRRRWTFTHPWQVELEYYGWVTIPKGFITDGATVPRILYWLFSPTGALFVPSLVHDYCLVNHALHTVNGPVGVDNDTADMIFYRMLISQGTPKVTSKVAYWGVRLGTWWRNKSWTS